MTARDDRVEYIRSLIRDVPDYPKPGIVFKDIAPLLQDGRGLGTTIELLAERWQDGGVERIAALESRGFPFGAALACRLGVGLAMLRKSGKLPYRTVGAEYELEYGTDRIEMHVDAVEPGQRVLLVDDLLATGGTAEAATRLLREAGAEVVGAAFVVELAFLEGRQRLSPTPVDALVRY